MQFHRSHPYEGKQLKINRQSPTKPARRNAACRKKEIQTAIPGHTPLPGWQPTHKKGRNTLIRLHQERRKTSQERHHTEKTSQAAGEYSRRHAASPSLSFFCRSSLPGKLRRGRERETQIKTNSLSKEKLYYQEQKKAMPCHGALSHAPAAQSPSA